MKIQLLQLQITFGDVDRNEQHISEWFDQYVEEDTDVVVMPEMWNNGYDLEHLNTKADHYLERSHSFIQQLAIDYHVDIVAGSVSNERDNHIYNTGFTVSQFGEIINYYDKVHLVPMLNEPQYLTAGKHVPEPFPLSDDTLVTQLICYDLRFPELLRYPARNGAKIGFYVAQWPSARLNHWQALLKARAVENDMFIVGVNSCGDDGRTEYAGHSMVINPNGEVIKQLSAEEDVATVEIDLSEVDEQRKNIPVLDNLKLELYK